MDKKSLTSSGIDCSRREFFRHMSVFSLLIAGWILLEKNPARAGPAKISKKDAHYQTHPDDGKMCMNCQHFIFPGGMSSMMDKMPDMGGMKDSMGMGNMMAGRCHIVAGPISPMGYCRFYQEKG